MEAFTSLLGGFETALSPLNLLYALIGVTLGTLVGVLPGIGPARVRVLHVLLGVTDMASLHQAAASGRLRTLPRFGAATEQHVLPTEVVIRGSCGCPEPATGPGP